MDLFSVDFTESELQVIRQSLDIIQLYGKDAKLIANLQTKLEQTLTEINEKLRPSKTQKVK
jgi:hypothetical protein